MYTAMSVFTVMLFLNYLQIMNLKSSFLLAGIFWMVCLLIHTPTGIAQDSIRVKIGAQIYIEPGQSAEDIEHYFNLLKDHNMKVCRIRMDETHMRRANGSFDFSLYDKAFDEAALNDVAVFATIFPGYPTQAAGEYGGVGGFKFPTSEAHFQSISQFIDSLVIHFRSHSALSVWVLQNEPGTGGNMPSDDFTQKKFQEWLDEKPEMVSYNDYLKVQSHTEAFMRDYTTWYLGWIASRVRLHDQTTELHVNPHMIFSHLTDYDFSSWQNFLSHLGASMHPSWHFGMFNREEYPLAMAANSEIIRSGANPLPFWVTELQGGNNNFSAFNPLIPSRQEIAQWMWTNIAAGAEGIIFWTLNPRATGIEAGEWSLVDFQRNPTPRLQMAGEIAGLLDTLTDFENTEPLLSNVFLLYSPESIVLQKNSVIRSDQVNAYYTGRSEAAHIKSLLAYYRVFSENGIGAQIYHMDQFDWDGDAQGKVVVLANMAVVPRRFYDKLKSFVQRGGKLLVTGQTAHFDEYGYNVMYGKWPLEDLFGASILEFRAMGNLFDVEVDGIDLKGHFLQGIIKNKRAQVLGSNNQDEILAIRNAFGAGDVVWVPSMLGIAAWENPSQSFVNFVLQHTSASFARNPISLRLVKPGLLIKHFRGQNGLYSVLINNTGLPQSLPSNGDYMIEKILFSLKQTTQTGNRIVLENEECVVVKWM
jgi:beta-galactosidase